MNYSGHEALRRDIAGLANNICDLKTAPWTSAIAGARLRPCGERLSNG